MRRTRSLLLAVAVAWGNPEARADETDKSDADTLTVTVRAPREAPKSASTAQVRAEEIRAVPVRTADDALRLVPGLVLVQHGGEGKGQQFFMRGFDASHGTDFEVTLAGIPLNEWSNVHGQGYVDLGLVIVETVDSVEVEKGPFSLKRGPFAMAGSANYTLRMPVAYRGRRASYTLGTTNRHRAVMSYSDEDGDGEDFIAADAVHDDGFGENRVTNRGALSGRVKLVESEDYGTVSLFTGGALAAYEMPGTVKNSDFENGSRGFYDSYRVGMEGRSGRTLLALSHEWSSGHHEVRTTVYGGFRRFELVQNYTGYLFDQVNGDARYQEQTTWTLGAQAEQRQPLGDSLDVVTGLGVHSDTLVQSQARVGLGEEPLFFERDLQGSQTRAHALLGLIWQPLSPLRLAFGARGDVFHVSALDQLEENTRDNGTLAAVSPRTTVEWTVLAPWRLFASYGRGFRPPEMRAFSAFRPVRVGISEEVAQGGEPHLTRSDSFEVGTHVIASRRLSTQLAGFATLMQNESLFDHVSGLNLDLNSTRRLGGEWEVTVRPLDEFTVKGDVTFVDARFVESGAHVPFAPRLTGGIRAIYLHDSGFRAGLRFLAVAPRKLPHGAQGATLTRWDATAGYTWRALDLNLDLENVLNQRVREGEYHYASHFVRNDPPSQLPSLHYAAGPPLNARLTVAVVF